MDFSKSHCPTSTFFDTDTEEEEEDGHFTAKFSPFKNHGGYDEPSLITTINKIIEENEKSILHAVEVASASVTQLESRTRRLENSMDDLKICAEFIHGRISRNLMDLENDLKKVHRDVKSLLDKQGMAEAKLKCYRTEPEPVAETQNYDTANYYTLQNQILDPHTCAQPGSFFPSTRANVFPYLNQGSEMSFSAPLESYHSCLVQQEQFEPFGYGRQQEQPILHPFGASDQSLVPANTKFAPPNSSFYSWNSSRAFPSAIPRAYFLDAEQSGAGGEVKKTLNEEIVEEVVGMGFRRDMVIAAVRKLTQNKEPLDMNTLLDKLMN